MNVLWISRHEPTQEQLGEIARQGGNIGSQLPGVIIEKSRGMALGARNINTTEDVVDYMCELRQMVADTGAIRIYGVFPTPILEVLHYDTYDVGVNVAWKAFKATRQRITPPFHKPVKSYVGVFAAWNINRAPEGESPQFQHKAFCCVGLLALSE